MTITDVDQSYSSEGWYSEAAATFGDRVAGAREALGLSQSDLAARIGVKLKTLRSWEDDLAEPRANKLQMLAGILNVSMSWLLTGEGDGLEAPSQDPGGSPQIAEILTEMRTLKLEIARNGEHLGRLEKKLRRAVEVTV
ncbi:MAG: helix-turn-helix transcriptional regulator [Pseudomonadota bacterium]